MSVGPSTEGAGLKSRVAPAEVVRNAIAPDDASTRHRELDGIRGWAATIVILGHLGTLFGNYIPAFSLVPGVVLDGAFPVYIFFVLSGDALSARFLQDRKVDGVRKLALGRYLRLTGMVLLACGATYVLMVTGLTPNKQAAALMGSRDWFATDLDFRPSLEGVLGYSVFGVYLQSSPTYNPFLWTMSVELVGSFLIFGYMLMYNGLRYKVPTTFVALIVSAFINPYAPLFFLGMLIGIARRNGSLQRLATIMLWRVLAIGVLIAFAVWDSYGTSLGAAIKGIVGAVLVLAAGTIPWLKRALTSRVSLFLGDISFPLYALQFPVMMSFTALTIILVAGWGWLTAYSAVAIAALSLAVMVVSATLAERLERPYLRALSRAIDRLTTITPAERA